MKSKRSLGLGSRMGKTSPLKNDTLKSDFFFYEIWVLLYPRNTSFPTGEKIAFYSLGRVARMVEPGKFDLPQDNRPYIFHFSSWRKINKLQIDFGSLEGEYYVEVKYFDQELFKGNTSRELRTVTLSEAPPYHLKNTHLYRISIYLENRSEVRTSAFPYHFSIIPLS